MYLDDLHVTGMRLLKDFHLSFRDKEQRKKWTVLIGRNATGKTSVLQAIALAAMGKRQVSELAGPTLPHLQDRRKGAPPLKIEAEFSFANASLALKVFPSLKSRSAADKVASTVTKLPKSKLLDATSRYIDAFSEVHAAPDPLDEARSHEREGWFIAGYGPWRHLPLTTESPDLSRPHLARLKPLFDPRVVAASTTFTDYFQREGKGSQRKSSQFIKLLQEVLFLHPDVLPGIESIERRGRPGTTAALQESPRVKQKVGVATENIPAVALANGHQSTIAWIADLIGHLTLDSTSPLAAEKMSGLVLIDEIDLYLHPTWQVRFVQALKRTFPSLQFIVTTHSPLMLASLDPLEDQIVQLDGDATTGDVTAKVVPGDPRVLTSSELLQIYFELTDVHPDAVGRMVRDYRVLASNPYRNDDDEKRLRAWEKAMHEAKVEPHYEPVPRRVFHRNGA